MSSAELSIKPIPTAYAGHEFRSRLEARWAYFFDQLNIRWEYESEGYDLDGTWYVPDFWLPDVNRWVEIKPESEMPTVEWLYLAGKADSWREGLDLGFHGVTGPIIEKPHNRDVHGCMNPPEEIVENCLDSIWRAGILFAWLNSLDCYGTLAEIGIAKAWGKKVWVAVDQSLELPRATNLYAKHAGDGEHDIWFVCALAEKRGMFHCPQDALSQWLPPLTEPMRKCARLSLSGRPVDLQFGAPAEAITAVFARNRCIGFWKMVNHARWNYQAHAEAERIEWAALAARSHRFW